MEQVQQVRDPWVEKDQGAARGKALVKAGWEAEGSVRAGNVSVHNVGPERHTNGACHVYNRNALSAEP
jgi:hypothetical protein